MRFLKHLKLNEEMGSEPETTPEGNEQPEETPSNERPDPAVDYEGWRDWQEPEEKPEPKTEETEPENPEETQPEENPEETEKEEPEEKEEKPEEKWNLKVEGEEVEYDPSDVEKTKEWVQKGMSAQTKWQQASKAMKQANQLVDTLKTNPRSILENPALGVDLIALSKEVLTEHYEMEEMSPREKALHAENRKLSQAKQTEELQRQQEQARQDRAYQEQLHGEIQSTLTDSGLPLTQDNIYRVNQYMQQAQDANIANVSPQLVIDYVKRDFIAQQKEFLNSYSPEQLMELLGKEKVENIRKQNVKAAIKQKTQKAPPKSVAPPKPKETEPKFRSMTEFLNRGR